MTIYDLFSFKAQCQFQQITGKNPRESMKNIESLSPLDERNMYFMYLYTRDNTITLEKVEAMSGKEIEALQKEIVQAIKGLNPATES